MTTKQLIWTLITAVVALLLLRGFKALTHDRFY